MPLTSMSTVYKHFPALFADNMNQHVRKRRETHMSSSSKGDEKEDEEVRAVCQAAQTTLKFTRDRERPPSRDRQQRLLMTKRSCTPLSTVSDNESEGENSPSSYNLASQGPKETAKRESPRPMTAGYFSSTISFLSRPPKWAQSSPRTAVSLDTVDLWEESDSEESAIEHSGHFDRINGIVINPSMTLDLASLRRSRSPVAVKRNKLEQTSRSTVIKNEPQSSKSRPSEKHSRERESRTKPRVRVNRKLLNNTIPNHRVSGSSGTSLDDSHEEIVDLRMGKFPTEGASHAQGQTTLPIASPERRVHGSAIPRPIAKIPNTTSSNPAGAFRVAGRQVNSALPGNKQRPSRESLVKSHVAKDVDMTGSNDSGISTSPERKVKFNTLVKVRDGDENTTGTLRESHNSAQLFKHKYLGNSRNDVTAGSQDKLIDQASKQSTTQMIS